MTDRFLKNKKVLFIGYVYYDYHLHICRAMRQAEADLDFLPIMNKNIWYLIFRQLNFKWFSAYNEWYAARILKSISGKEYDYVLVTAGYQLPAWFYYELKKKNKNALFINYSWDSVRQTEHKNTIIDILQYFDMCYSFDRKDCEIYGIQRYLPLFYIDDYSNLINEQKDPSIDILFIGSLCTEVRYNAVKQIEKICTLKSLVFYYYMLVSYRFYFKRILNGKMTRNIHFKSIKHSEIIKYYSASKAVIDLAGHEQSGLTMRTFEILGAGKKLITTNENIKLEEFYDSEYINVIVLENPEIDVDFVNKDIINVIDMSKYNIHSWLKNLFFL